MVITYEEECTEEARRLGYVGCRVFRMEGEHITYPYNLSWAETKDALKACPYRAGERYLCVSWSRLLLGYTWFAIGTFNNEYDPYGSFSALCFSTKPAELDLIIHVDDIPKELFQHYQYDLTDNTPILYRYKNEKPPRLHAGDFHYHVAFPRYSGGPYVSGSPIVQIDNLLTLTDLLQHLNIPIPPECRDRFGGRKSPKNTC